MRHAPCFLLLHATGFHGRVRDEVVRALPDTHRVIAVEMRGHGRSSRKGPFECWAAYGGCVVELIEGLGLAQVIGAGHSMGGSAIVRCALGGPQAFRHLVPIDPMIGAPEFYAVDRYPDIKGPEERPACRPDPRRCTFTTHYR